MTQDKKPDNVIFNTETQKYDAALKPYATSVGAPVITTTDTIAWKNRSINKINHKVAAKYMELKDEYEKMMQQFDFLFPLCNDESDNNTSNWYNTFIHPAKMILFQLCNHFHDHRCKFPYKALINYVILMSFASSVRNNLVCSFNPPL